MARQTWISADRYLPGIVLFIFLLIYLALPAGFSTTDAWNYAAEIKYKGDLFYPYHLLYNVIGYLFCYLPARTGFDILDTLKVMNAIFAVLSIWVVQLIIRELKLNNSVVVLVSCLAGSSFSLMRYATENETYIIPLFSGLVALFFFLQFVRTGSIRNVLLAGLFSSLSVLLHMTYVFWWFAILAGFIAGGKRKSVLLYLLTSIVIPVFYLLAVQVAGNDISPGAVAGFILDDFRKNSHLGISGKGLLLSAVNLIRSFVQVHGYLFNMIKDNYLLMIPGITSVVFFVYSLFGLRGIKRNNSNSLFIMVILMITILQFIFALLSFGNAEFMVMIPVLASILLNLIFSRMEKFMMWLATGLLLWNLSYGLIPLMLNSPAAADFLCDESLKCENSVIIAADDQLLISMIYYRTGSNDVKNIYKSPAVLSLMGRDTESLDRIIDSALIRGQNVYTDCAGNDPLSRATILEGTVNRDYFSNYETEVIFTLESVTGRKIINRITGRIGSAPD